MIDAEMEHAAEGLRAADNEESLAESLGALLEAATGYELRSRTFEEAGVLTYNSGIVVCGPGGEFQLTVVRSG